MALAHPLHPIDNKSRNRRRNLWVGWYVSSWWPLFSSKGSVLVNIYTYIYISFTNCVLLSDNILWLFVLILNNTLILGIWCSTIPHLQWCFCPLTFFQNIGFNMVPSDPFMSHLATQLIFCRGVSGFATDCPCNVWCRGLTISSCMLVHLLEIDF